MKNKKSVKPKKLKVKNLFCKEDEILRTVTGIYNLDSLICGGFVQGSTNLVVGGPGCGKSIFAMQFLVKGVELGEGTVFVSVEEDKRTFYRNMKSFGWDLNAYEKSKKFFYLKYTPEQIKSLLEEGGGEIERAIQSIKAKRLVIDSITAFSLLYPTEVSGREALLNLFSLLSKYGCTTLLTAEQEAEPDKYKSTFIEFEVDSVLLIYKQRKVNSRLRVFEILKMRGTKFEDRMIPFKITSKGVVLYPDETII